LVDTFDGSMQAGDCRTPRPYRPTVGESGLAPDMARSVRLRQSTAGCALHVSALMGTAFLSCPDLEPGEGGATPRGQPGTPSEGKISSCDFSSSVAAGSWGER